MVSNLFHYGLYALLCLLLSVMVIFNLSGLTAMAIHTYDAITFTIFIAIDHELVLCLYIIQRVLSCCERIRRLDQVGDLLFGTGEVGRVLAVVASVSAALGSCGWVLPPKNSLSALFQNVIPAGHPWQGIRKLLQGRPHGPVASVHP